MEDVWAAKAARAPSTQHPAGSQAGLAKGAISWGETQTAGSTAGPGVASRCRMQEHPWAAGVGSWSCTPGLSGPPRLRHPCPRLPAGLRRCRQGRQPGLLETRPQARRGSSSRTGRPRHGRGSAAAHGCRSCADTRRAATDPAMHSPAPKKQAAAVAIVHRQPRGFGHIAALRFATRNRWWWQDTEDSQAVHGGRAHPDPSAFESMRPQGVRVKEMSPQQLRSEPSVLSPASQLPVSTQNDSSSPSPLHSPFFQVPKGTRVRANALAKAQPCPSTGTAKGRRAEERLGGKYPSKAAQREGQASPKNFRSQTLSTLSACYLQLSLQQCHWGKSSEEKKYFIVGTKLGSITPN